MDPSGCSLHRVPRPIGGSQLVEGGMSVLCIKSRRTRIGFLECGGKRSRLTAQERPVAGVSVRPALGSGRVLLFPSNTTLLALLVPSLLHPLHYFLLLLSFKDPWLASLLSVCL